MVCFDGNAEYILYLFCLFNLAMMMLMVLPGNDDVHLSLTAPEEVPGLLHAESSQGGAVNIHYLISQQEPTVPRKKYSSVVHCTVYSTVPS